MQVNANVLTIDQVSAYLTEKYGVCHFREWFLMEDVPYDMYFLVKSPGVQIKHRIPEYESIRKGSPPAYISAAVDVMVLDGHIPHGEYLIGT